jgi:hypothetical protein
MGFKSFNGILKEISRERKKEKEKERNLKRKERKEQTNKQLKTPFLGDSLAFRFGRNTFSDL